MKNEMNVNLDAVMIKADQFRLVLAKNCAALEQEDEDNIEVMNETVTRLISEAAIEVGGKTPRQPVGNLSQVTKDLVKKRQNMTVWNSKDKIEFAELSKAINKKKVRDIRNYNDVYALKYKQGNIVSNFDGIVKAAEEFYTALYSSQSSQATSDEVRRALQDMIREKLLEKMEYQTI